MSKDPLPSDALEGEEAEALAVTEYDLELADKPSVRDTRALRSCLRCDARFTSDGFGNRICPECSADIQRMEYGPNLGGDLPVIDGNIDSADRGVGPEPMRQNRKTKRAKKRKKNT